MQNPQPVTKPDRASRRTFLGGSLTTALTVAAANGLATLPVGGAFASGDDRIRVGLIGCGGRGTGAAFQAAAADPGVQVVAMGDLFADQIASSAGLLTNLGSQFDCPMERRFVGTTAYQSVIDAGVDLVLLTAPPHLRPLHLSAAVRGGKHLFCEKPVAIDIPGVHQVKAACKLALAQKVSLVSGLCFRRDEPTAAFMRQIHDGQIGQPLAVRIKATIGLPWRKPIQAGWSQAAWRHRNWISFAEFSGGHFVEHHIHALDKALWALGDAAPVSAMGTQFTEPRDRWSIGDCPTGTDVRYRFADGSVVLAACRRAEGTESMAEEMVIGSAGRCDLLAMPQGANRWNYRKNYDRISHRYQAGMNALLESVRSGSAVNDGPQIVHSTLVAMMGRMAAQTGRDISWQEFCGENRPLTQLV